MIISRNAERPALVVLAGDVENPEILLRDMPGNVHLLQGGGESLLPRLRTALVELWRRSGMAPALHLVGHGAPGEIHLDRFTLNGESAGLLLAALEGLPLDRLALHGCRTGAGAEGRRLIARLEAGLGAPVHAARDILGRAPGGESRWELDRLPATLLPFAATALAAYPHALDTVSGTDGDDSLTGDSFLETLLDRLIGFGGKGDDTLVGGAGADTFVFSYNGGNETVADFEAGTDSFSLAADLGIAAVAESGGDTVLTLSDGGTVTLTGVSKASLLDAIGWIE